MNEDQIKLAVLAYVMLILITVMSVILALVQSSYDMFEYVIMFDAAVVVATLAVVGIDVSRTKE